jgi:hypothetical protein
MANLRLVPILCGVALLAAGCASPLVLLAPEPPSAYQVLGSARGSACGTLAVYPFYYLLPVLLNERVERAHEAALASVAGARALIDVEVRETSYWWVFGTTRCMTISGKAIR